MTIQVRFKSNSVFVLEFEDQEEYDEWEDNGACLDDATITQETTNDDWEVIKEADQ